MAARLVERRQGRPAVERKDEATTILYVSVNAEMGGAERVLLNIVRHHDVRRYRPVVALLRPGPLAARLEALQVPCRVIPARRFRHPLDTSRVAADLRRVIRDERVVIVHGVMAMGHLYGTLGRVGTRARAVWFQHGNVRGKSAIDRLAALAPSAITYANSQDTAEAQRTVYNRTGGIRVVYCGVDLTEFCPDRFPEGERIRQALGVEPDRPLVGMAGRFERWKGQHVFLQAAAIVRRAFPRALFLLAGDVLFGLDAGYKGELQRLVLDLGLKDAVRFLGFRGDMPAVLLALDVAVHASTSPEPLGLTVLEAMAMGRAVVATDAGGPRETVEDGVTGWLVPMGDPVALADRIGCLLADAHLRREMGAAGRRRVAERFSMQRMIQALESSYDEILARPG